MFSCSTSAFKATKLWDNAQILNFCFSKNFLGTFEKPIRRVPDMIVVVYIGLHGFFSYQYWEAGDQKDQVKFLFY